MPQGLLLARAAHRASWGVLGGLARTESLGKFSAPSCAWDAT